MRYSDSQIIPVIFKKTLHAMRDCLTKKLRFVASPLLLFACLTCLQPTASYAQSIALTFDDGFQATVSSEQAIKDNARVLATLKKYGIKSMLFPNGPALEYQDNLVLVKEWGDAGHILGNHTFSH